MSNNILTWEEVKNDHKVINGIYTKNKIVKSLLCKFENNILYPNKKTGNKIIYYINPQTQLQGSLSLIGMCGNNIPIKIYEKVGVNKWIVLGDYSVIDVKEENEQNNIQIILQKIK